MDYRELVGRSLEDIENDDVDELEVQETISKKDIIKKKQFKQRYD